MIQNFLSMNGYGLFVWLSFAITFIACGLFFITKHSKHLKSMKEILQKRLMSFQLRERKLVSKIQK